MRRSIGFIAALGVGLLLGQPAGLSAQDTSDADWLTECRRTGGDDRVRHCEVRELRMPAAPVLHVVPGRNGGARVSAGSAGDVGIRARIQAYGDDEMEARATARSVNVVANGGQLRADGPSGERGSWSVSFVLTVPAQTNLDIETHNGPVSVRGVNGTMNLRAVNGPIHLNGVGGEVRARTQNGPITVSLAGRSWNGAGLDAETRNGPVSLALPADYSARLETGTVNGPMNVDFPMTLTVQGRLNKQIVTTLGSGGAPVRVVTTNGPVRITRR